MINLYGFLEWGYPQINPNHPFQIGIFPIHHDVLKHIQRRFAFGSSTGRISTKWEGGLNSFGAKGGPSGDQRGVLFFNHHVPCTYITLDTYKYTYHNVYLFVYIYICIYIFTYMGIFGMLLMVINQVFVFSNFGIIHGLLTSGG